MGSDIAWSMRPIVKWKVSPSPIIPPETSGSPLSRVPYEQIFYQDDDLLGHPF